MGLSCSFAGAAALLAMACLLWLFDWILIADDCVYRDDEVSVDRLLTNKPAKLAIFVSANRNKTIHLCRFPRNPPKYSLWYIVLLMKIFVLTMLLAVVQTAPPIPRQTTNSPSSASQEVQNKPQQDKTPPTNQVPALNTVTAPIHNESGDKQGSKDGENSVVISKPVSVTVAPVKRDWVDFGIWIFDLLLVVVGVLQWRVLKKQSELMGDHAGHLKKLADETQSNVDALKAQSELLQDSAQRDLRAYLGVANVYLTHADTPIPKGQVAISNFGKTPAYKVRQWIGIAIGPYPLAAELVRCPYNGSVSIISPTVQHQSVVPVKKPIPPELLIGTLENTVYVYGQVTYEDAFGHTRNTSYRYIYGGSEGASIFRNDKGVLFGVMKADVAGNEAD